MRHLVMVMKMKTKYFKIIFSLLLIMICIFVVAKSSSVAAGYYLIWLWPVAFSVAYFFLLSRMKVHSIHKIAIYILIYYRLLMKYVVYPVMVAIAGTSYINAATFGINISEKDIVFGTLYGLLELVVVSIFVYFFENYTFKKSKIVSEGILSSEFDKLSLSGPEFIYPIFLIIGIVLFYFVGLPNNIVGFLKMDNYVEDISKLLLVVRYIIISFMSLGIMGICSICSRKKGIIGFIITLSVAALFIGVVQSGSRASQLYVALIMISILCIAFPKRRKTIVLVLGISFAVVLLTLTMMREGRGSGWFSGDSNLLAQKFQIYFGGPSSIMTSIKVLTESEKVGFSNLIYDHVDIFPLSLFLNGHSTSEIYNLALYNGESLSGHVIFTTSYGYIFFGLLGIPIPMIVNILVCTFFNRLFYSAKTYELKYMFGFALFRCTSGLLVNLPSILSGIIQYIFLYVFLILFIRLFFTKKGIRIKWEENIAY